VGSRGEGLAVRRRQEEECRFDDCAGADAFVAVRAGGEEDFGEVFGFGVGIGEFVFDCEDVVVASFA